MLWEVLTYTVTPNETPPLPAGGAVHGQRLLVFEGLLFWADDAQPIPPCPNEA